MASNRHGQGRDQTLGDLLIEFWRGKVFVLCGCLFGLALGAAFLMAALPHHKAVLVLAPSTSMDIGTERTDPEQRAPSFKALTGADYFTRFQTMYKGAAMAALLLRDDEILAGLKKDQAFVFSGAETAWSPAMLAAYIEKRVRINPVGETNLRGFEYLHADAVFPQVFLTKLHETTDGLIRHSVRKDVNERIGYLKTVLSKSINPDLSRTYTALLLEQERLKMLVSTPQPFAAAVVEPAFTAARIAWPRPALVLAAFAFSFAFLGFAAFTLIPREEEEQVEDVQVRSRNDDAHTYGSHEDDGDIYIQERRSAKEIKKLRDWVRKDHRNTNENYNPKRRPFSSEDAAE